MRPEVIAFLNLGPLPSEEADEATIERAETALHSIAPPLDDDEAEALMRCFGKDECFGLAWTLVHLIETSPTACPRPLLSRADNAWLHLLNARSQSTS